MRINLKAKIILPISIVLLMIIFSFMYTYYSINTDVVKIYEIKNKLDYIKISINEIYSSAQSGILTGNPAYSVKMAQKSLEVQDMIQDLGKYGADKKNYRFDFLDDIRNINKLYIDTYAKIVSVNSLFLENRIQEGSNRLREIEEGYTQIISAIDLIIEKNRQMQAEVMKNINVLFAASAAMLFLMFIAIAFMILPNIIIKPITVIKNDIGQIADGKGDLTKSVNVLSNDEIGDLCKEFNRFINSQAQMIREIIKKSKLLSDASDNLKTLSKHIEKLKNEGLEIIRELISNVENNTLASENVRDVAQDTVQSVEKIKQKIQMIQDIASQTNMLALNASIESVKAGEAGKGFSVVASEIRKLAEQSNKFSRDIIAVINEVVQKTNTTVKTIERLSKTAAQQEASAKQTNDRFEGIAHSAEKMRSIIADLDVSFEKMLTFKDEMIEIIHNLSAISQHNAAGTQQAAASVEEQASFIKSIAEASEQTSTIACELENLASRFKV